MTEYSEELNQIIRTTLERLGNNKQDFIKVMDQMVQVLSVKEKAFWFLNVAARLHQMSEFKVAVLTWNKALEYFARVRDKSAEAECYANLAIAYLHLKEYRECIGCAEKALAVNKNVGHKKIELACNQTIGRAYTILTDYRNAIVYYEKALEISRYLHDQMEEARCCLCLGSAYQCLILFGGIEKLLMTAEEIQYPYKKAIEYLERAVKISDMIQVDEIGNTAWGELVVVRQLLSVEQDMYSLIHRRDR